MMCADNGVVAEGVTQTDASVTGIVAGNVTRMESSVCLMAKACRTEVVPIDIGMNQRVEGVRDFHVADGTNNFAQGPAMTREQAEQAIQTGIDLVKEYKEKGYQIIVTGEMGIGNTTSSSAVAAVLLGRSPEEVTGRGAGLSDAGLVRKIAAIEKAIKINNPDPADALDVVSKVGGYDICGMIGLFLGGALYQVPVLIDGLISSISALAAFRLCPNAKKAMIASHRSAEPIAKAILDETGLNAIIMADMKLGEGTGAICMLPILDMALSVYHGMVSFGDIGVEQYTDQVGVK